MNVLYLTNKPIYPSVDGGCVAMASFLNHLLQIYPKVHHLTIETHKHPFNKIAYEHLKKKDFIVESVFLNTKISTWKAFKNLFSTSSYNVNRFHSQAFEEKLTQYLSNKYDIIFLESIYMLPYLSILRKDTNAKIILRTPNIEFKIWEKRTSNTNSLLKKIYLNILTKKLKNFELNNLNLVDGILTISKFDENFIQSLNTNKPIMNLPFSIQCAEQITQIEKNHYFFIGAYNWQPNLDAINYLIKVLFPKILKANPKSTLHIAGSYTPESLYKFQSDSIKIYGKVDSVIDFMSRSGILIAPIFSGSGVRIKILEALSLGIPVIGSKLAIQGINSEACFIADSDDDYISIIQEIENSEIIDIQNKAVKYINENYHHSKIEIELDEFVKKC